MKRGIFAAAAVSTQFAAAVEPKGVPELMTAFDGRTKIETVAQWEGIRAPELLEKFTTCEYGRRPVERPGTLAFETAEPDRLMMDGKAIRKRVRVSSATEDAWAGRPGEWWKIPGFRAQSPGVSARRRRFLEINTIIAHGESCFKRILYYKVSLTQGRGKWYNVRHEKADGS